MKRIAIVLFAVISLMYLLSSCGGELEYDSKGKISGTVIDLDTGEPIQSALITLSPGGLNTYTGYDGSFDFIDLEAKQYTLTAQKTGYAANRKTVTTISGSAVTVSLVMQKSK